jgi:hypothetical protein
MTEPDVADVNPLCPHCGRDLLISHNVGWIGGGDVEPMVVAYFWCSRPDCRKMIPITPMFINPRVLQHIVSNPPGKSPLAHPNTGGPIV